MKFFAGLRQNKFQDDPMVNPISPTQDYKNETRLPPINSPDNFGGDTNKYVEDLKSGQNNILVAVRTRPLNSKEVNISNFETIRVLDGKVVVLLDPLNQFDANDVFRSNRNKEKQYAFDFAFDHTVDTETVFENTTKFLIPGVLNGFNATVFAYGATGAGKTFTMLGGQNKPGIMFLTVNELFKQIKNYSGNKDFVVKVCYMEIYNETLRDLLSTEDRVIDIREDTTKGIIISGMTEITTSATEEIMDLLTVGGKNRTMEATGANIVSSRSHAVLQVTVEHRDRNQGINEEVTISKLSMIDLAGSERASNTNNTGQRMIEGANINRSLLALGNCITLLSEKNEKGLKNVHIPYRDSKLTRMLKDSLGGNCRTVMIANVSPAVTVFEDTHNTLKYANRAKNIKTKVARNVLNVENHVEKYAQIISDLKQENNNLKKLLQTPGKGMPDLSPVREIKEVNSELKQSLLNEIKQQFDLEIQIKKRIFDSEIQSDDVEERVIGMQNDGNVSEDKALKAKYDELLNMKKRLALQTDELRREYGLMSTKRNQIVMKIQKEKNKDTVTLLQSIFKQNQMTIENLELQQKEKRVESQLKLKDKELKYLQSQLAKKDGKTPDPSFRYPTHTPNRSNQTKLQDDPFELLDENISFFTDFNERDSSRAPKVFSKAKQALYLPTVNPKVMHVSPTQASRRVIPSTRKWNVGNLGGHNNSEPPNLGFPTSLHSKQPSQYYYKKQEFMIERTKPFEITKKPQKKRPYVPLQTKVRNEILTTNRRRESIDKGQEHQKTRGLSVPHGQNNVKSLTDLSHVSTASSSHPYERKRFMGILPNKGKIVNRYASVASRYGASPYIQNNKAKKK